MKKKVLLIAVALGALLSLSGCGCLWACLEPYSTVPFGYTCGHVNKTGVRVTSDSWSWYDLAVYQRGMIVEVYRGDKIIRRYDLRIPRQEIDEYFNATNLYGDAVRVRVEINGFKRVNVVYCYSGRLEEYWFLS